MIQQIVNGGFVLQCVAALLALGRQDKLEYMGIVVALAAGEEKNFEMLAMQDELASCMGTLALQVVGCRLRRCARMLRGWPNTIRLCASASQVAAL